MIRRRSSHVDFRPTSVCSQDAGFSLVEVVIAMVLFALLTVGILPLILTTTQLTVTNSDKVRAKSLAQQKLASIQRDYPTNPSVSGPSGSCNALASQIVDYSPADASVDDLTMISTAGDCPGLFPGTVPVHIKVKKGDTVLTEMHTSIRVTSE